MAKKGSQDARDYQGGPVGDPKRGRQYADGFGREGHLRDPHEPAEVQRLARGLGAVIRRVRGTGRSGNAK